MSVLDASLSRIAGALRGAELSAAELVEDALARHRAHGDGLQAYKLFDEDGARTAAARADERLAAGEAPALCGIPVSVKDLYGVDGLPTFAGTPRRLPDAWSRDAWLVARLRAQGAVIVGKTHTVELAYGAVGLNPHWPTPRNPWDAETARIPGGSSSGAGVSLHEGSALVALGSDTGGSVRIPAALTGTVGHKTTKGRWPTDGVVQLSHTLDTVGALTRSVEDSLWFFGAVDPAWGDPRALEGNLQLLLEGPLRLGVPESALWRDVQPDAARVLDAALEELEAAGWDRISPAGNLVDAATDLYFEGGIPGAELKDFLAQELPEWPGLLDPVVARRLEPAPSVSAPSYQAALQKRRRMELEAGSLFADPDVDVLALPANILGAPPLAEVEELDRYVDVNHALLRPTCWVGMLGLCAVTLPVGRGEAGMPVGLQLVAPAGSDAELLGMAVAAERTLGTAAERLGRPPDPAS